MSRVLQLTTFTLLMMFHPALAENEVVEPQPESRVIEEGQDFVPVVPAQPTSTAPGQVEILEFFWYGCPHCYQAEEHIKEWRQSLPEDIVFRRIPATLNQGWVTMTKAYYTAELLGVLDTMHPALFAAFHETGTVLADEDQLAAYFKEQAGVEEAAFREAFNSMVVASRVQHADVLARRYRVAGVPTMTVNGKYKTDPEQAGGYSDLVDVVRVLVERERQAP